MLQNEKQAMIEYTDTTPETVSVQTYDELRRYGMNRAERLVGALHGIAAGISGQPTAEAIDRLATDRDELHRVLLAIEEATSRLAINEA